MNGCAMNSYPQMSYFYEEKRNSIEVLLLGDSNIYRGFSPMVYWKDTGITSYSFASASQPAWLSYYALKDALQYQKPKVVVFEINELFADAKGKTGRYCAAINTLQSAPARLKAIADTASGFDEEDREILYRSYIKDTFQQTLKKILPNKEETVGRKENFKGYLLNSTTIPYTGKNSYMSRYDMQLDIDDETASYIDKIADLCKDHHAVLLFVKLPTKEWTAQKSEFAKQFAKQRDIPFLDLNIAMEDLDWSKDTKDSGFHMNDHGATKVTKYLEGFIKEYGHPSKSQDPQVISSYNASYKRYEKERQQNTTKDMK